MLPLVFFVSRQPDFVRYYPYFRLAKLGAGYFLLAQLIQLLFMFCWEFLLRGYLLFGYYRRVGYLAVVIQTIPFVLLHIHKPELEALGSLVAGLALGVVAIRAGSFLPCALLHFLVAATLDLFSVVRF
jgi:membrane protease YdiL (CAAX protease family)